MVPHSTRCFAAVRDATHTHIHTHSHTPLMAVLCVNLNVNVNRCRKFLREVPEHVALQAIDEFMATERKNIRKVSAYFMVSIPSVAWAILSYLLREKSVR